MSLRKQPHKEIKISEPVELPKNKNLVEGAYKTLIYNFDVFEDNVLTLQNKVFIGIEFILNTTWENKLKNGQEHQPIEEKVKPILLQFIINHMGDFKTPKFKRCMLFKSKDILDDNVY